MTDPVPASRVDPEPMHSSGAGRGRILPSIALACTILFFADLVAIWITHPTIPTLLLALAPALPLGGIVLGTIAKWTGQGASPADASRARTATRLGLVEVCLVLLISILLPSLCRAREPANRVKCASNLKQIGLALAEYARANNGRYPPDLSVLLQPQSDLAPAVFTCPSSSDVPATGDTPEARSHNLRSAPGHLSYVYVGAGLSSSDALPGRVLVYEPLANHGGEGMNVLYTNGDVTFIPMPDADRLIAELQSRHSPPHGSTTDPSR